MIGILSALLPVASTILDRVIPDKNAAQKAKLAMERELTTAFNSANLAQIETNKIQAAHPSIFVSGARPAIMWICAFGLGWQFVFQPVAVWAMAVSGVDVILPIIETEGLMTLTMSLLGLGGMRSFEKSKGIQRNNMKKLK
jgi:hypothetical protein|tara:strand:- start:7246 stop:7668 length:423 start_codon:yes stop_codon:yes gene_type:complete